MNLRSAFGLMILFFGCLGAIFFTVVVTDGSGMLVSLDASMIFSAIPIAFIMIVTVLFSIFILFPMIILCRKSVSACIACLLTGWMIMVIIAARIINFESPEFVELDNNISLDLIMYGFCFVLASSLILIGYLKMMSLGRMDNIQSRSANDGFSKPCQEIEY